MILDWNGTPEFRIWENAPKFRNIKLSELIDRKDDIMKSKMYLKVNLDIDISYEEANFLKETFINEYDIREISLIQEKNSIEGTSDNDPNLEFKSVDHIITDQIVAIESDSFDTSLLLDIYNNI